MSMDMNGNGAGTASAANSTQTHQLLIDEQTRIIARLGQVSYRSEEASYLHERLAQISEEDSASSLGANDSDSESDMEESVVEWIHRRNRQRPGRISSRAQRRIQMSRLSTRRALAAAFGSSLDLHSLYDGSLWGHEGVDSTTDESLEEEDGAVGHNARSGIDLLFHQGNTQVTGRSFLGQTIVEARANVRRALLVATMEIRRENPGQPVDFAWMALQNRLVRERVVQWESEVSQTWYFAFNQPARLHFQSIYQADLAAIEALWDFLD